MLLSQNTGQLRFSIGFTMIFSKKLKHSLDIGDAWLSSVYIVYALEASIARA